MTDKEARKVLEHFYSLQGEIPLELSQKLSPKQQSNEGTTQNELDNGREQAAITRIFNDPRITSEQRELISNSILNGKFKIVNNSNSVEKNHKSKPRILPIDHEKNRIADLTISRHALPKQNFLEVVTQSTVIPVMNGEQLRKNKLAVLSQKKITQEQLYPSSPSDEAKQIEGNSSYSGNIMMTRKLQEDKSTRNIQLRMQAADRL